MKTTVLHKNIFWIILFAALLLLSAAALLALKLFPPRGTVAKLYQSGALIRSIDLSRVDEPYEFTVTSPLGENTVRVEPGRIRVVSADCPDGVCVNMGWLSSAPIVCLPHEFMILTESSTGTEADAGTPDGTAG